MEVFRLEVIEKKVSMMATSIMKNLMVKVVSNQSKEAIKAVA